MINVRLIFVFCCVLILQTLKTGCQETKINFETITRDEILQMTTEQLLALPLEDLVKLGEKLGVSIDELLKMQTSVASHTALTTRETPGIISIIGEEDIRNSGARDMIDVLQLVPGFDFEYDVDGVIGLGFRGSWVHEGKALILVDGQMMNDLVYYNTIFGNHFDVTQIKKIEIIRGPGSAIYGGNAELCVINIVTKSGKDIQGISANAAYGQLPRDYGRINGTLMAGINKDQWDIALKAFYGEANRSDGKYTRLDTLNKPITFDFSKNGSKIQTQNINLSVKKDGLAFHFIYDQYNTQAVNDSALTFNKFTNITSSLQYDFKLSDKINLIPFFSYQYSEPFNNVLLNSRTYVVQRAKAGVGLNYNISENANIIAGGEYYSDYGQITDNVFGSHILQLASEAFYCQLYSKILKFNLVLGGRYEYNNSYGSAFAPRLAITRIFKNFHFKILASQAFRTPAVGNIDVSTNLKVEKTLVLETELGYKLNENMFITGNIYDISITDPIIYYDNGGDVPVTDWGYTNASKQGSNGLELEYRYKYLWGFSTINYSIYTDRWKTIPAYYSVPGNSDAVLGLPQNKFTILSSFKLSNNINIAPSVVYTSKRFGYALGDSVVENYSPALLINLNLNVNNFIVNSLNLSLSAYNIFNQQVPYIEPYNGGYPPYPGRNRELLARLTYNFKLRK